MSPEAWSAIAAWVTAAIALVTVVVAGVFARRQVAEARKQVNEARSLREEQAQPYVVAVMDIVPERPGCVDFVIKNFGKTGAHDIRISVTPPPLRAMGSTEERKPLKFPEKMPFLAPGQEWRTLWDYGPSRKAAEMDERYEAVVECNDSKGNKMTATRSVFDWGTLWNHTMRDTKTLRDVVKELDKVHESISAINATLENRP